MSRYQKTQLNRADLLTALVSQHPATSSIIAKRLGLHYDATIEQTDKKTKTPQENVKKVATEEPVVGGRATASFWIVSSQKQYEKKEEKEITQETISNAITWKNRPLKAAKHQLIAEPKTVLASIFTQFKSTKNSRQLDTKKLVAKISKGKYITRLPKQQRRQSGQHIHFIDDRKNHLIPYWRDHYYYQAIIASHQTDDGSSYAVCIEGQTQPRTRTKSGLVSWQLPPKESLVIIMSDLGALAQQGEKHIQQWLYIGEQLQRQQCKAIVLLPCHPNECDKRFKTLFHLQAWEGNNHIQEYSKLQQQAEAKQLLIALSPVIRLEPSLIRAMRLAMRAFGTQWQSDAAIESIVWQHPDIQERHSVAATLNNDARLQNLHTFSKLSKEERKTALNVIREWRGGNLSSQVWFEEVATLDSQTRQLIPDDVCASNAYFMQYRSRLQLPTQDSDTETQDWFLRVEERLPYYALEHDALGEQLQQIKYQLHKHEADYNAEGINPRNLRKDENSLKKAVLYQQGNSLRLMPFTANSVKPNRYSPVALLSLRHPHIYLKVNNKRVGELHLRDKKNIELAGLEQETLTVMSDCETQTLKQWQKKQAIDATGRDEYGLYLDMDFNGITQRFRYIQPSTFMMGSKDNEPERDDDEDYHQVSIPQAYWMADTAVTQDLWQAIMSDNPSDFKGKNNPVENVSWHDTQLFIDKLISLQPSLNFRLPTEAEWENACRAGTTSPFSLGDNMTTEQVNYDGNYPYNQAKKGEYLQRTVPVKSRLCNDWGLYEMHGNVWEWCQDTFQKHLGTKAVVDRWQVDSNKDANRVLRGGSWFNSGRFCRSAMRNGLEPDHRYYYIGFRLILGHMSSSQVQAVHSEAIQDKTRRGAADKPVLPQNAKSSIVNKVINWIKS